MHRDLITGARRLTLVAVAAAAAAGVPTAASAQSLGPMRGQVQSVADRFALRLRALNYADTAAQYTIRVFNPDFTEIPEARVSQPQIRIGANSSESFIVTIPFIAGEQEREVLVCSESEPFASGLGGQMMRGQVCGRYFGRQLAAR